MRVLILSQYYAPEPVPKPAELAEHLYGRGHSVSVVTGFPNYPSGRLYDGFRLSLRQREQVRGIPVLRTFEYPYHGPAKLGRVLNYASFMVSAMAMAGTLPPVDVIYVYHPPLTIGLAARVLGWRTRAPFVYDVQDIWPEGAVASGFLREGRWTRALSRLERFVYRGAGHLLTVTEGARANLIAKGVPAERVSVMPHWVDEQAFGAGHAAGQALRRQLGWEREFVLLFAGNLGLVQGLDSALLAMQRFGAHERVRLVLVGDGADRQRLGQLALQHELGARVQFIERLPQADMPPLLAAADALLVHLKRAPFSALSLPTKTLAYLATGRPILMAVEGTAAELIEQADAGVLARPEDPDSIAAAVRCLLTMTATQREQMGQRGQRFVTEHFARADVLERYEALLARVASQHGRPARAGEGLV
jgi:glycosyltransferase involved in cell wall biosynthesis